ncbi:MAG: biopolymer transporter ExbD [Pedobacter sp.]|nr:MAG: biopolymer transporter ExbD [Pedobacter sp.]
MATLNIPANGKAVKRRSNKALPSVDLTAMVDLAFLLITFFMLTTSLAKMKAMDVVKPVPIDHIVNGAEYPASRTLTILMGKDNKAVYYMGVTKPEAMSVVNVNELTKFIAQSKKEVAIANNNDPSKHLLVIIKPTKTSKYKNFVDLIDEMKIANIQTYAIDDKFINDKEQAFLDAKVL